MSVSFLPPTHVSAQLTQDSGKSHDLERGARNLILAVIVDNASSARDADKEEQMRQKKEEEQYIVSNSN